MTRLLRFVGILNAAIWFGSAIFLIIGVPPLFSAEMKKLLGAEGVGFAAETVLARFFILQYICAGVGFGHLIAEWLYFGRPLVRLNLVLLGVLTVLSLLVGFWAQPRLHELHHQMYHAGTAQVREQATRSFGTLHGISQSANLLVITGLLWYLWSMAEVREPSQIVRFSKIRG